MDFETDVKNRVWEKEKTVANTVYKQWLGLCLLRKSRGLSSGKYLFEIVRK